ncbi:8365_t:CDS:2, partial [Funneliformis caledonium]
DCYKLGYLDCSNNYQNEERIDFLDVSTCKKLKELHANHCGLGFLELAEQIYTLNLAFNNLSSLGLDLTNLADLEYLNIGLNVLSNLNLTNNKKLKHIYCYENQIEKLEVKHLTELENLFCYHNNLRKLDCSGLKNLKDLYCTNTSIDFDNLLKTLNVNSCEALENLDCAENNGLNELNLINLPKLSFVSTKECGLNQLEIKNCPSLKFLDFKKVLIEERKVVKDKDGNDEKVFFIEEIDALAQRNTSRVIKILANPNDYSLEDILKLGKKELKGVSEKLKEKLVELAKQKYEEIRLQKEREFMNELRRKFNIDEEGKSNPKKREGVFLLEKDSDSPSEKETPLPTPQELPTPKNNNKDKN